MAFLSFPQQDVPFEVRNGVVEHRGLKVDLGELQITTKGTVNLTTEEYDLTASVAFPDNLLQGRDGLLASLRGQPLEIPIRGSFSRPPDLRGEIARFFQQNAGNAVAAISSATKSSAGCKATAACCSAAKAYSRPNGRRQ